MTRGVEKRGAARGRTRKSDLALQQGSVVGPLATQAIRLGADELDIEYKGGLEQCSQ